MRKKEKMQVIHDYLCQTYGDTPCTLTYENPFELLVSACLAAQCTDARVNMVTPALFAKYPTVKAFAEADTADVEEIIRSTGFFRNKAKNIVACANVLIDRFDGKVPDNMEDLLSLPGVGRKIANLLLGDVFGKPCIVVDTHCKRITGLLGLTKNTDPAKIEVDLKKIVDPEYGSLFCHQLVEHGRNICIARRPQCSICGMNTVCDYYNKNTGAKN
ncbi:MULTISPECIES: endonuclease III [Congzhengia]|jgi:endonuclease-3|uniref:Endonuclease III n=1 Tax=Congzhengia minquanensis TaxID=2763657 RepID=A0A926DJY5_9FIRM|nr:endonuclease III [Congzhengia minquanensis]MBC8539626.1 endonuclease III [Congzhengia minquanensis]MBD8945975.1 endonuclease III [Clostridiales bacterium]HBL82226.1 endonuclease III [Clostridiales bacterium]